MEASMVAPRRRMVAQTSTTVNQMMDRSVDPAFHRAILKIAIELRKPNAKSYEVVVSETIRAMKLNGTAFRHYLGENGARNMNLLLATARAFGL